MRKALQLVLVASMLAVQVGCATNAIGGLDLNKVDRPAELTSVCAGEIKAPDGSIRSTFEDDLLRIEWSGSSQAFLLTTSSSIGFVLQNKSNSTLKINWDGASFVDASGESRRVMHSGVKFMTRDEPQPPSVIAKGGTLTDSITPTDAVVYGSEGWGTISFLDKKSIGRTVKVLLPIESDGKTYDYLFEFTVLAKAEK
jgi:hypothetical protein